jgi:hypothetical protein
MQIVGLDPKFLYWPMTKKAVRNERKTNMYLLIQANDVREAYDNTISVMKGTMGDYTIPAVSESLLWMFFLILEEGNWNS